MSARHRARQAVIKMHELGDDNWAYEVFTEGKNVTFFFDSDRSAQLVAEALRHIFKRKPLIHKGRKP